MAAAARAAILLTRLILNSSSDIRDLTFQGIDILFRAADAVAQRSHPFLVLGVVAFVAAPLRLAVVELAAQLGQFLLSASALLRGCRAGRRRARCSALSTRGNSPGTPPAAHCAAMGSRRRAGAGTVMPGKSIGLQ
jgi:hypothetical protein